MAAESLHKVCAFAQGCLALAKNVTRWFGVIVFLHLLFQNFYGLREEKFSKPMKNLVGNLL